MQAIISNITTLPFSTCGHNKINLTIQRFAPARRGGTVWQLKHKNWNSRKGRGGGKEVRWRNVPSKEINNHAEFPSHYRIYPLQDRNEITVTLDTYRSKPNKLFLTSELSKNRENWFKEKFKPISTFILFQRHWNTTEMKGEHDLYYIHMELRHRLPSIRLSWLPWGPSLKRCNIS
jgi:hypothetical protein